MWMRTKEAKVGEQIAQLKSVCGAAPHPNETRENHGHVAECVPFSEVRWGEVGRGGEERFFLAWQWYDSTHTYIICTLGYCTSSTLLYSCKIIS